MQHQKSPLQHRQNTIRTVRYSSALKHGYNTVKTIQYRYNTVKSPLKHRHYSRLRHTLEHCYNSPVKDR